MTTSAAIACQRVVVGLWFALAILLFSIPIKAAPCDDTAPFSIQIDTRGLVATLSLRAGAVVTAKAGGNATASPRQATGGKLVLLASESLEWLVSVVTSPGPSAAECTINFLQVAPKDLPEAVFSGQSIPNAVLENAHADFSEPRFFVQPSSANSASRLGKCGEPLLPGGVLPTKMANLRDLDLQLGLADGKCLLLLQLHHDTRKIVVQQGSLRQEVLVGTPDATVYVYLDAKDDAECSLVDGKGKSTTTACSGVIKAPAEGALQEMKIPVTVVTFRALRYGRPRCPALQPASAVDVDMRASSPRKVKLCAYAQRANEAAEVISMEKAFQTSTSPLRMQSCVNGNCTPSTELQDDLSLPERAEKVHLQLIGNGSEQLSLSLAEVNATQPISVVTPTRTVYLNTSEFAKTLRSAICLGIKIDPEDSGGVNTTGLVAKIDRDQLNVSDWLVDSRLGSQLCPKNLPLTVEDIDKYEARLTQDKVVVTHSIDDQEVSRTVLRSYANLPIISIQLFTKQSEGKVGTRQDYFVATRNPPLLGDLLCLQMSSRVSEENSIRIDTARITTVTDLTERKLGNFTAGSETSVKFQAFATDAPVGANREGQLYCAELAHPGQEGLEFSAVDGANTQQPMSFAWDGKTSNCKDKKAGGCGKLEQQWYYGDALFGSLRYSHLDVGAWRITGKTSQVRLTAMLPFLLVGGGHPALFSSVSLEGGLALPTILASTRNDAETAGPQVRGDTGTAKVFAGIGLGAYSSVCLKIHVEAAPRVCGGVMADYDLDLDQKTGGTSADGQARAGYFFTVGAGVR